MLILLSGYSVFVRLPDRLRVDLSYFLPDRQRKTGHFGRTCIVLQLFASFDLMLIIQMIRNSLYQLPLLAFIEFTCC